MNGVSSERGLLHIRGAVTAALVVLVATLPSMAHAHPHVFIENTMQVLIGNQGVEGVRCSWTFDPRFSDWVLQNFKPDREGAFSEADARSIEDKHLANLRESQYFLDIRVNGMPVPLNSVADIRVEAVEGRISYAFTAPIRPPSSRGQLEILVRDPSGFTRIDFAPNSPVVVQAPETYAASCAVSRDQRKLLPDILGCTYQRR
jgi:ABC-type uncharacterized transport system substrate-binding protein